MRTLSRRSARLSLVAYLGFVLLVTQIPTGRAPMEPNLAPLAGILSTFRDGGATFGIGQLIGNLILLAPLGVLLPLAHPRMRPVLVVAVAFALACAIELTQGLVGTGRMGDIDDVWLNTLGAAAGLGLGGLLGRPKADR